MNPRDLPRVVSELIIEMHEVRSELRSLCAKMQAMPERIGMAVIKSLELFLNPLLVHDNQFRNQETWLGNLESLKA